jgi:hypothetical protein
LLCVKYGYWSFKGILDPQILARCCYSWLETASCACPAGKEVIEVKYFKITKTWAVKAESEAEAIKLIAAEPVKYLDSETVTRTEYKRPQPKTGWGTAVKEQLLGANSKR